MTLMNVPSFNTYDNLGFSPYEWLVVMFFMGVVCGAIGFARYFLRKGKDE